MISDERLKELADDNTICKVSWDERVGMAKELLTLRKALSEPVAWTLRFRNSEGKLDNRLNIMTTYDSLDKAQSYGKGSRYEYQPDGSLERVADPSLDPQVIPLYSASSF